MATAAVNLEETTVNGGFHHTNTVVDAAALHLQLSESPATSFTPEQHSSVLEQDYESICWGCGLRLILPSNAPIFKCGWCGAITKQDACKQKQRNLRWIRLRDRCFVTVLLLFITFVIGGGFWAVYPVLFSVGYLWGLFHCMITFLLGAFTLSMFSLAAFCNPGTPLPVVWGSFPTVQKDELRDYTFCHYCSQPKSPRTHHCSSCGLCVLDMDHHCPFIGNCVGAANHRHFIIFLIAAVVSVIYAALMCAYAVLHISPSWGETTVEHLHRVGSNMAVIGILKNVFIALLTSALFFSTRGLVLLYLFVSCISVGIGLTVLLWQQLYFIYEGRTYLTSLSSQVEAERDCRNLYQFFGSPYICSWYLRGWCNSKKIHRK